MTAGPYPCPQSPSCVADELANVRNRKWTLAATVLGSSMEFIDGTVVNVAIPSLQHSFGISGTQVQWVVEVYALFLASLLLVGGSFGDRFGLRRTFLVGVLLFAFASVWCGLAPSLAQLLIARSVQGIAGALLVPNSLALLSGSFTGVERGRAIGTWSGFAAIMTAVGPILGGWMVQHGSWRWVFFINIPIALSTVVITLYKTHRNDVPTGTRSVDWSGALLGTAGLSAVTFSLMEWENGSSITRAFGLVGIVLLVAFVLAERRADDPLIPVELFRSQTFTGANLLTFFLYAALSGMLFYLPINLIQIQEYTPTQAGAAMVPLVVTLFLLSPWAGGLVARFGPRLPLTFGPLITAGGYALLAIPSLHQPYWSSYFPAMIVLGIGMAISVAPLTTTVMISVTPRRSGSASGINNAVSQTAALLALAVSSPLFYRTFAERLPVRLNQNNVAPSLRAEVIKENRLLGAIQTEDPMARTAIDQSFVSAFRLIVLLACGSATAAGVTAVFTLQKGSALSSGQPSSRSSLSDL